MHNYTESAPGLSSYLRSLAPASLGFALPRGGGAVDEQAGDPDDDDGPSDGANADDLESGRRTAEVYLDSSARSPGRKEKLQRCMILRKSGGGSIIGNRADSQTEFLQLVTEDGDFLLAAKFFRQEGRVDIFLGSPGYVQQEDAPSPARPSSGSPRRYAPAFSMSHNEGLDEWLLVKSKCERCLSRPRWLSCKALGKGQQVACIRHCRVAVGKARVHNLDVHIPALFMGTEMEVWCPARIGYDLGRRAPPRRPTAPATGGGGAGGGEGGTDSTPGSPPSLTRRSRRHGTWSGAELPGPGAAAAGGGGGGVGDDGPSEPLHVRSRLPEWDEAVQCLYLNFDMPKILSSPQNFMLCVDTNVAGPAIICQHALISEGRYSLDFRHPLSAVQAFAIAVTTLLWED